jgi:hypothetical protein
MNERDLNLTQKKVDVAPDLKTMAIELNVRNFFRALRRTPIGSEYPLPTIAKVVDENLVQVHNGTHVIVHENEVDMIPGKRVIIYKQGEASK